VKLLLPDYLMDDLQDPICAVAPDCQVIAVGAGGEVDGDPEGVEVLFMRWDLEQETLERFITRHESLRWVHSVSAGVDHLPFPQLMASDITLTNASGVFDVPVAELVMAFILAAVKRLPQFFAQQQAHEWNRLELGVLPDLTAGIVCMGAIGSEIARLCRAFGMRVIGLQRQPQPSEYAEEVFGADRLHELLARSDFVVVACPLTEETRGLIGREELTAMKPQAWLINIARGPIVDQEALIDALREERIGGAALDVFAEEPLPEDSPLWELPNVILTPHNAGSTPRLEEEEARLFLENLRRYVAGQPLLNVVDKRIGY